MSYDKLDIPNVHAYLVDNLGINLRNLKVHRDFLQDNKVLVQKHLDMEHYAQHGKRYNFKNTADSIRTIHAAGLAPHCGSTMCIVGWAVANPALQPELDELFKSKFFGWEEVSGMFISRMGDDVGLFNYLFGPDWEDSVDLAIERMDSVIAATLDASNSSTRFLCAAANTRPGVNVGHNSAEVANFSDYVTLEDLMASVLNDERLDESE